FGSKVALSSDGNTLAVGAHGEDSNATGIGGDQFNNTAFESGAVYVFTRSGANWSQQAYIKASNTDTYDRFGTDIALSADGSTLAVGAPEEDSSATGVDGDQANNLSINRGAVYVFFRTGASWAQQAYAKASNKGSLMAFGYSVALSADGSTLAVGAYDEDSNATGINSSPGNNTAPSSGAAYLFTRTAVTWSHQAYIKASSVNADAYFGLHVALSADGNTLAVGAPGESSNATGINGNQANTNLASSGAVYIFVRSNSIWTPQAHIKASNAGESDSFGLRIALSADGNTLAVGAYGEASSSTGVGGDQTNNSASISGAVYVFTRSGSAWSQSSYVKASNTGINDGFSWGLALSADGQTLAVSALHEASNATGIGGNQSDNSVSSAGAVYLY
ncbi:MAG: FG-GAP repeat protein, partial [Burkholderiaceae bacterium]